MRSAIEPPIRRNLTLAELIHRLETIRLAALADGDHEAANQAAAGKAALERRRIEIAGIRETCH